MFQWLKQLFTRRGSKSFKQEESEWIESIDAPKLPENPVESAVVQKAVAKRKRRLGLRKQQLAKGAFGKPKVMRRDRGD